MTQKDKIELLKDSIAYLYEKEGRSISYISRVLLLNRKELGIAIRDWELIKADVHYLKPSSEKFLNKNRKLILDMLSSDATITEIAQCLRIERSTLVRTFISNDKELLHCYNQYKERAQRCKDERIERLKDSSGHDYDFDDLPGEIWLPVLGYDKYQVSNMGRVKSLAERYGAYYLMRISHNVRTNRCYVSLLNAEGKTKNLNLARLVANHFVLGHSAEKNTVDHIDGDVTNNRASNLEWVSQSENNRRAYQRGKPGHRGYSRNGRFKKIVMDDQFEFKTIRALGRFLGVSESQAGRLINGECQTTHTFHFVY